MSRICHLTQPTRTSQLQEETVLQNKKTLAKPRHTQLSNFHISLSQHVLLMRAASTTRRNPWETFYQFLVGFSHISEVKSKWFFCTKHMLVLMYVRARTDVTETLHARCPCQNIPSSVQPKALWSHHIHAAPTHLGPLVYDSEQCHHRDL